MAKGGKQPGAGRPKGSKAAHTLEAQEARVKLIKMVHAELEAIVRPQIEKAKKGDTQAYHAITNRAWGMPGQSLDLSTLGEKLQSMSLTTLSNDDLERIAAGGAPGGPPGACTTEAFIAGGIALACVGSIEP